MKIVLIPCGHTEWHEEGRLLGRVELPLTEAGQQGCTAWAERLTPAGIQRILHAPDELATQTAAVVARRLCVPTRAVDDLAEVDIGLWAGLTESQIKTRFASAHRELGEAPLNVSPPGGEAFSAAAKRLRAAVRKQLRKDGVEAVGVVVRPLAFAVLRCTLEGRELTDVWAALRAAPEPAVIDNPAIGAAPRGH